MTKKKKDDKKESDELNKQKPKVLKQLKKEDLIDELNNLTDEEKTERKKEFSKISKRIEKRLDVLGIPSKKIQENIEQLGRAAQRQGEKAIAMYQSNRLMLGMIDTTKFYENHKHEIEKTNQAIEEIRKTHESAAKEVAKVFSNREFRDFIIKFNENIESIGNIGKAFDQQVSDSIKGLNLDSYYESLRNLSINFKNEGRFVRTRVYLPNEKEPLVDRKTSRNYGLGLLVYEILLKYATLNKGLKYHMTEIVADIIISEIGKKNKSYEHGGILTSETSDGFWWFNRAKGDGKEQPCSWNNLMPVIARQRKKLKKDMLII